MHYRGDIQATVLPSNTSASSSNSRRGRSNSSILGGFRIDPRTRIDPRPCSMHARALAVAILTVLLLQHAAAQAVLDFDGLEAAVAGSQSNIVIEADITLPRPLVVQRSVVITGGKLPTGLQPHLKCGKAASAFDIKGAIEVNISSVRISGCTGSAVQLKGQASLALDRVELFNHSGRSTGVALKADQCQRVSLVLCTIHDNSALSSRVPTSVIDLVDVLSIQISNTAFSRNEASMVLNVSMSKPKRLANNTLEGAPVVLDDYSTNFKPLDPFQGGGLLALKMINTTFGGNHATEAVMSASNVLLDSAFLRFLDNTNSSRPSTTPTTTKGVVLLLQHSGATLHSLTAVNNTNFFSVLYLSKMATATNLYGTSMLGNVGHDIVRVDGCNLVLDTSQAAMIRGHMTDLDKEEGGGFDDKNLYDQFVARKWGNFSALRHITYLSPLDMNQVTLMENSVTGAVLRIGTAPTRWQSGNLVRLNTVLVSNNVVVPPGQVVPGRTGNLSQPETCRPGVDINTIDVSGVVILGHAFGTATQLNITDNVAWSVLLVTDTNVTLNGATIANNLVVPGPAIQTNVAFMEKTENVLIVNNSVACGVLHMMSSIVKLKDTVIATNQDMRERIPLGDNFTMLEDQFVASAFVVTRSQFTITGGVLFIRNKFQYMVSGNFTVVNISNARFEENDGGGVFMYTPFGYWDTNVLSLVNLSFVRNRLTRRVLGALVIVAPWWRQIQIDGCTFERNQVVSDGTASGGLYIGNSINHMEGEQLTFCCQHSQEWANITNSRFVGNYGLQGGGAWIGRPSYIENCTFTDNRADAFYYGMDRSSTTYATVYNTIANETSNLIESIVPSESRIGSGFGAGLGGALYLQATLDTKDITAVDNAIARNTAQYGGGVFVDNNCALIYYKSTNKSRCNVYMVNNTLDGNKVLLLPSGAGNAPAVFFITSRGLSFTCKRSFVPCDDRACRKNVLTPCLAACAEWTNNTSLNGTRGGGSCGGLGTRISRVQRMEDEVFEHQIPAGLSAKFTFRMFDEYEERVEGDLLVTRLRPVPSDDLVLVRIKNDQRNGCEYTFPALQLMPLETPKLQVHYIRFVAENGAGQLTGVEYRNYNNVTFRMRPCGLGEYLNLRVCMSCRSSDAALFSNFYNATCQDCPPHGHRGICKTKGFLIPDHGFWQPHMQSPHLHRCPLKNACAGRNRTEQLVALMSKASERIMETSDWDDATSGRVYGILNEEYKRMQCSKAYTGNLCGVCREGFGRLSTTCYKCSGGGMSRATSAITFLLILVAICCVLAITVWCQLSNHHERREALQPTESVPVATPTYSPFGTTQRHRTRQGNMSDIFGHSTRSWLSDQREFDATEVNPTEQRMEETSGGKGEEKSEVKDVLLDKGRTNDVIVIQTIGIVTSLFKLLVTYVQGLSCLRLLNIQIPFLNFAYSVDPSEAVSLDCLFPGYSAEGKAIMRTCITMFLPVIILIFSVAFWLLRYVVNSKEEKTWRQHYWPRILMTAVQIGYYLHQMSTAAAVSIFTCYKPADKNEALQIYKAYTYINKTDQTAMFPDPRFGFWTENYDTECFTGRHEVLTLAVGLPWLLLFSVGLPVTFAFLTWKHREELFVKPDIFLKYGFLYEEYKVEYYGWESIIMLRKIALLIACTLLGSLGIQVQLLTLLLITMVSALAHEWFTPFAHESLNVLERVALFLLGINVVGLAFLALPLRSDLGSKFLLAALLLITCGFAFWVVAIIVLTVRALLQVVADYDGDKKFGWSDFKVLTRNALTQVGDFCCQRKTKSSQKPSRTRPSSTSPPRPQPAHKPYTPPDVLSASRDTRTTDSSYTQHVNTHFNDQDSTVSDLSEGMSLISRRAGMLLVVPQPPQSPEGPIPALPQRSMHQSASIRHRAGAGTGTDLTGGQYAGFSMGVYAEGAGSASLSGLVDSPNRTFEHPHNIRPVGSQRVREATVTEEDVMPETSRISDMSESEKLALLEHLEHL